LVQHFLRAAAGEHLDTPGVVYVQGKEIQIESTRPLPVQLDGDPAGYTPVQIDLLPTRLAFIVPN
jgi:diacylglycerol kinase (ATP)